MNEVLGVIPEPIESQLVFFSTELKALLHSLQTIADESNIESDDVSSSN
jgi:hypothetical protein